MSKLSFDIKCKKCGHEHNQDDLLADDCLPVSDWGQESDSVEIFYCNSCGEEVKVQEHVSRWWEVI